MLRDLKNDLKCFAETLEPVLADLIGETNSDRLREWAVAQASMHCMQPTQRSG